MADSSTPVRTIRDLSSLSNPHEAKLTHLLWDLKVDFDRKLLEGEATYTFDRIVGSSTTLDLDTSELIIHSVTDENGNALEYKLHPCNKPHLGQKLSISIEDPAISSVKIKYETTDGCSAIQWLPPSATSGKVYPYLFTQCQAIHGRSLVPCQDLPGVKMTYTANVTVPSWSTCVMSAVLKKQQEVAADGNWKVFSWEQKVPISSYLLAMAVGQLDRKDISERCAIWSEPAVVDAAAYEFAQTEDFLSTAESLSGAPYAWGRYDLLCLPPSCPYGGMENPCLTFVTPTLLAGDRSLADVVAHEIAHSWTGNLVTNATWDHFWLNEGWTTWFQRKIMARIHNNDKFLDFDAIGGWNDLEDTVKNEMAPEHTKLVLDIGDRDPDESYSIVSYEKGFNFLMALERRVGKEPFERFFQSYVNHFSYKTVTSEEFKAFFLNHFNGNESIKDIQWDKWLYSPGMPPETPNFDKSMAQASEDLAVVWHAVDRNGRMIPTQDIKSWSSLQITTFLDALQSLCNDKPLKISTLNAMNKMYGFAQSQNSEILHRYCQLSVAAEDESILPVVVHFITSQGRMKFVRPLYRALHKSKMGQGLATQVFLENQDFYHPICAKMIASDLMVGKSETLPWMKIVGCSVAAAALLTVGVICFRRSRRM